MSAVRRPVIGMVLPSPLFDARGRSVPTLVSTSDNVRFSASETLSPAPYRTLNRTGSTIGLFEQQYIVWQRLCARPRRLLGRVRRADAAPARCGGRWRTANERRRGTLRPLPW